MLFEDLHTSQPKPERGVWNDASAWPAGQVVPVAAATDVVVAAAVSAAPSSCTSDMGI